MDITPRAELERLYHLELATLAILQEVSTLLLNGREPTEVGEKLAKVRADLVARIARIEATGLV